MLFCFCGILLCIYIILFLSSSILTKCGGCCNKHISTKYKMVLFSNNFVSNNLYSHKLISESLSNSMKNKVNKIETSSIKKIDQGISCHIDIHSDPKINSKVDEEIGKLKAKISPEKL